MIYLVRHGQTVGNQEGYYTGQSETELNEIGIRQASEIANVLKNVEFDVIFCSPLKRAKDTCNIINSYHGKKIVLDDRLMERSLAFLRGNHIII